MFFAWANDEDDAIQKNELISENSPSVNMIIILVEATLPPPLPTTELTVRPNQTCAQ